MVLVVAAGELSQLAVDKFVALDWAHDLDERRKFDYGFVAAVVVVAVGADGSFEGEHPSA